MELTIGTVGPFAIVCWVILACLFLIVGPAAYSRMAKTHSRALRHPNQGSRGARELWFEAEKWDGIVNGTLQAIYVTGFFVTLSTIMLVILVIGKYI